MRICFATNYLPECHSIWGGAEQATYRLMELLARKGYQVSVFSTLPIKKPKAIFDFFPVKIMEDYLGRFLGRWYTKAKLLCLPFDPISFIITRKLLKRVKPDILHLHKFDMLSFSLVQNARSLGIPVLATIYDYGILCPKEHLINSEAKICESFHGPHCIKCYSKSKYRYLHRLLLFFRRYFSDFFLKKVDAFIVLSVSSAKILYSYGINKKKVYIIRQVPALREMEIDNFSEPEENSILYVGWVEPRKGLHILIEAMSYITKEFPDAKLYAIGELYDEGYKSRLQSLIKKFNLNKNIIILGRRDHSEVRKFIRKARLVVVPEQWQNMSPVVLTEAMAYAKAIVASRIGGIPEFIEDGINGFLAKHNSPVEFANKIIYIFKNTGEAKKMGNKAREDIARICDEGQTLSELLELYRSLLPRE